MRSPPILPPSPQKKYWNVHPAVPYGNDLPLLCIIPRLCNHNATDDDNVDFRSIRKIFYSKHEKSMQCSGFVSS